MTFHVDTEKGATTTAAFVKSEAVDNTAYATHLSPNVPLNETCKRIVGSEPLLDRLIWRRDVLVVRCEGQLGLGHEYKDVGVALMTAVKDLLKRVAKPSGVRASNSQFFSTN
jgi:hypothetical protein